MHDSILVRMFSSLMIMFILVLGCTHACIVNGRGHAQKDDFVLRLDVGQWESVSEYTQHSSHWLDQCIPQFFVRDLRGHTQRAMLSCQVRAGHDAIPEGRDER